VKPNATIPMENAIPNDLVTIFIICLKFDYTALGVELRDSSVWTLIQTLASLRLGGGNLEF
jgi:hypothetical protein